MYMSNDKIFERDIEPTSRRGKSTLCVTSVRISRAQIAFHLTSDTARGLPFLANASTLCLRPHTLPLLSSGIHPHWLLVFRPSADSYQQGISVGPPRFPLTSSICNGANGAPKNAGPRPLSLPRPTQLPGAGYFFGIPCPCPRSGPPSSHTPDRFPLKISGNKRCPVQGMSGGGPWTGAGWGLPETYPPSPV